MMKSETIGKLAEALSKAQSQMGSAKKDSINPYFKNKYADLASVIEAIKEPMSQNGFSYTQTLDESGDHIYLFTFLMHTSGEWISSKMKLFIGKQDMQAIGSAITYARRYALSAIVGLTQDDDDGDLNRKEVIKSTTEVNTQDIIDKKRKNLMDFISNEMKVKNISIETMKKYIQKEFQVESSKELSVIQLEKLIQWLDKMQLVDKMKIDNR